MSSALLFVFAGNLRKIQAIILDSDSSSSDWLMILEHKRVFFLLEARLAL